MYQRVVIFHQASGGSMNSTIMVCIDNNVDWDFIDSRGIKVYEGKRSMRRGGRRHASGGSLCWQAGMAV